MAGPFIFIGTHTFKEGKLEDFKRDSRALADLVKENEPRILSFNLYFNEDETEVSVVQVHPDADSMVFHMQVVREHITHASDEQLVTKDIQIYGTPNDMVLGMIKELSQSGVTITVKPNHHAGFIASDPEPQEFQAKVVLPRHSQNTYVGDNGLTVLNVLVAALGIPDFVDNLVGAEALLRDASQTPVMDNADRRFLIATASNIRSRLSEFNIGRFPLHGEPHLEGNVLKSSQGPLLIDLEAACIGPYEWDLTALEAARPMYSKLGDELLAGALADAEPMCKHFGAGLSTDVRPRSMKVRTSICACCGTAPPISSAEEQFAGEPAR